MALIFLLLSVVLRAHRSAGRAGDQLADRSTDELVHMDLQAAIIRFVIDFPLQMLWIVAWAVTVGIVLHTLNPPPAAAERPGERAGG